MTAHKAAAWPRRSPLGLLIDGELLAPHWLPVLARWRQAGHGWWLLGHPGRGEPGAQGAIPPGCEPDGWLEASQLLADWLTPAPDSLGAELPNRQILLSGSLSLQVLARELGLLTLGPCGGDQDLAPGDPLGPALTRLLAKHLTIPALSEVSAPLTPPLNEVTTSPPSPPSLASSACLTLRPLQPGDDTWIRRYCRDGALSRYTLNIPHPYPDEGALDWLRLCWRRQALGQGWSWAITLDDEGAEEAVGTLSLGQDGSLAWWVGLPWQNRGLATRAARLVRDFAFGRAHLPEINACHMTANLASGRVMAKLGMVDLGVSALASRPDCLVRHWRLAAPGDER
ncbi:GNAT family N-acetyltransferase [Aeromonas bivalvium]|uniref:GNAT family N-acetyltransferase n=1 Tax=Aeromonas bivalvium TaxID=440079 RepID=UPI0038D019C6